MSKIHVDFVRGKKVESTHQVKALVTTVDGKVLLSTNNDNEFFFDYLKYIYTDSKKA